ncbi:unnamed protein product, partial [Laminaria digitata]
MELDAVRVEVSPEGAEAVESPRELQGPFPISFGVLPPNGDANHRVRLHFVGLQGGRGLVETVRIAPFLPNETALLQVTLSASCIKPMCERGSTCGPDGCRP